MTLYFLWSVITFNLDKSEILLFGKDVRSCLAQLVSECLTRYPGVLSSTHTRSHGFIMGVSFVETLQSPSLEPVKPRKDMNCVSCYHDETKIMLKAVLPFPKKQILDSSKLREFADNSFKFDKNGRKFSNWVENTVGKGEIACCFQKTCSANT